LAGNQARSSHNKKQIKSMNSVIEKQALRLLLNQSEVAVMRSQLQSNFADSKPRRQDLDLALRDCQEAIKKLRRALRANDSWRDWELKEMVENLYSPNSYPYYEGALLCAERAADGCNAEQSQNYNYLIKTLNNEKNLEEIMKAALPCFSVVRQVVGFGGSLSVWVDWHKCPIISESFDTSTEAVRDAVNKCWKTHEWEKA